MNSNTRVLGIVSIVPMGDWSPTTNYQKLNYVRHNNANYLAYGPSINVEPGVAINWQQSWMFCIADGGLVVPEGTYPEMTVGNAVNAQVSVKATQDGNGNVIVLTYATKGDLASETAARQSADNALQTDIDGIMEQLAQTQHFRGYYETNAQVQALANPQNGDYAWSAQTGTVWNYSTSWSDSGVKIPDQTVPKSSTTPLMDGTATLGSTNTYADGGHRHPTDTTRASAVDLTNETSAREAADTNLQNQITNIKNGTTVVGAAKGAQYLSRRIRVGNASGDGWYKFADWTPANVANNTINSIILLVNGINASGLEPCGKIEIDVRHNANAATSLVEQMVFLGGYLDTSKFCAAIEGNTVSFYVRLQPWRSYVMTILDEESDYGPTTLFKLYNTFYNASAPANAVYATVRNNASEDEDGNNIVATYAKQNGSYPTLGAGYLAKNLFASAKSNGVGWYEIAQFDMTSTSYDNYSAILLINGIWYTQTDNYSTKEESGLLEIELRSKSSGAINSGDSGLYVLAGNIDTTRYALVVTADKQAKLYWYAEQSVASVKFTLLDEQTENSVTTSTLSQSFYGTSAPSGAVYAVNRNYAAFDSEGHPFSTGYVNTETDQLIAGGKVFSTSTWTPMAYIGLVNNDTAPLWQFTPAGIYYIPNRSNLLANKLIAYDSSKGLFVLGTNLLYNYNIPDDDDSTAIATTHWVNQKITAETGATPTALGFVYGSTTTEETAIGYNTSVAGSDATAVGVNTQANGDSSTAIGRASKANYFGATALGYSAEANNEAAVALGAAAIASASSAAQIGNGTNNNANTLQFLNHQVMDANGQIPASALSNANSISMVPYGGQATTLSALASGGVYSISANGYLRIAYQTTAADNFISMKQVSSSGADIWGFLANGQKSYGSGYPFIYMPVAAGDHIKVEFGSSVKIIQVQLIKVKGVQ